MNARKIFFSCKLSANGVRKAAPGVVRAGDPQVDWFGAFAVRGEYIVNSVPNATPGRHPTPLTGMQSLTSEPGPRISFSQENPVDLVDPAESVRRTCS